MNHLGWIAGTSGDLSDRGYFVSDCFVSDRGIFSTASKLPGAAIAYNCSMSSSAIQKMLNEIEELLASAGDLVPEVELAVEKLLNKAAE